ncbi:histidine phosphatase family protein [Micromonospora sp. NPDC049044]|uniref:histidine phosphatase family protein n=1 Tax=unclassified Micromonospora TaxID=2617518 RepID=UPI0033F20160
MSRTDRPRPTPDRTTSPTTRSRAPRAPDSPSTPRRCAEPGKRCDHGRSPQLDAETVADLAEQDYGTAGGRPWTDVVAEYGDIPALDADRPLAAGGETWRDYLHRASVAIGEIMTRYVGERVLVGHGETIDAAFHHFLAVPVAGGATASVAAYHERHDLGAAAALVTRPSVGP